MRLDVAIDTCGLRIILDASTRRFQTHKIYLRAAAAMRWVGHRAQILQGQKANGRHANALHALDEHLRNVGLLLLRADL